MSSDQENAAKPEPFVPQPGIVHALRNGTGSNHSTSRDEMNLAEFPLTVLSTRSNNQAKTLEFQDQIRSKNGELINRSWVITGADKFGLPTSSDDEVLLGLLKLTVDSEFVDRKVFFSRYELLRALRWSTEGRSYSRLTKALDRLSGVRIKATNAFYENDAKSHSTRNFGIIDAYEINDGRAQNTKPSFFTWSETLFRSFTVGFIKKLDLDFYLNLRSAVAKRLYRYLDKHFWYRAKVEMNLFVLAHEKIGVSRTYQHVSSLRQQLDPAFEELISAGFIESFSYTGKGTGATVSICAQRGARSRAAVSPVISGAGTSVAHTHELASAKRAEVRIAGKLSEVERTKVEKDYSKPKIVSVAECASLNGLDQVLVTRGLRPAQVERLLSGRTADELQRITMILAYFDHLVSSRSHLVNRSPIGFLYRAVERPGDFVLPGEARGIAERSSSSRPDFRQSSKQGNSMQESLALNAKERSVNGSAVNRFGSPIQQSLTSRAGGSLNRSSSPGNGAPDLESRYLVERKREIETVRAEYEPTLITSLRSEVEGKMGRVRDLVSPARFSEAIEQVVNDKLLKLAKFPEFPEWMAAQRKRSRA